MRQARRSGVARGIGGAVVLAGAILLALITPGVAFADSPVLPNTDSLPWTDPSHHAPLEELASQIASQVAQHPVRVYCDGDNDWANLGTGREFDPNSVAGFVDAGYYYTRTRTFVTDANIAHLSPTACTYLWRYGMAAAKPTKCATTTQQIKTVITTVSVSKRVKVRVKVNGKWKTVTRTITTTKQVPRQTTQDVPGPPAPCHVGGGVLASGADRSEYRKYVFAFLVLAHESIHLLDIRAGSSIDRPFEIRAECFGMQWVARVATQFGATPDDAQAAASYTYTVIYPSVQGVTNNGEPYWSADCRENGPLDLSPGDGIWP